MAGLDNMLRVVRRRGGALRWQKSLPYRPAAGPVLIGETVVVPGYGETPLPVFAVETGAQAGALGFDGPLVALPVFTTPSGRTVCRGRDHGRSREQVDDLAAHAAAGAPDRGAAAYGVAWRGGAAPPAAALVSASSSSATAAPNRRTPSRIRSGGGAENDSRTRFLPLPLTKNASPAT